MMETAIKPLKPKEDNVEQKQFITPFGPITYWVSVKSADRPGLVFLPGLTADHALFEKQTAYFSEKNNCLVWDAPAHGLSRPFTLSFSMEDMADWLHAILQTESVVSCVLVGQSLGGYIAQVFSDRYPDAVSGFVSVDSCPLSRKYYSSWELALLKNTDWMYRSIPFAWLKRWGISGVAQTAYGRSLMAKMWSQYNRDAFCELSDHGYRILAQAVEAKSEYPIRCPTLLLCGTKDMAGSAKRYNRAWAKQDGKKLIWLEGAGHNANADAPDRVNALIDAFLSEPIHA